MKREYQGEPIDGTVSHLSEIEVPGDDNNAKGTESVSFGSATSLQSKIHELNMLNPESSTREIADELNCSHEYVYDVLRGDTGGKYERYRKSSWGEYTEKEKKIIRAARSDKFKTRAEIAETIGVSGAFVSKVVKANSHIIDDQ